METKVKGRGGGVQYHKGKKALKKGENSNSCGGAGGSGSKERVTGKLKADSNSGGNNAFNSR